VDYLNIGLVRGRRLDIENSAFNFKLLALSESKSFDINVILIMSKSNLKFLCVNTYS
jgi:hypothetical protein